MKNNPLRSLKKGAARKHGLRNSVIEDPVVMEGMLSKRSSGILKRWQSRHFKLRGHYLYYSKDQGPNLEMEQSKKESLGDVDGCINIGDLFSCKSNGTTITLELAAGNFEMRAMTSDLSAEWTAKIQGVQNQSFGGFLDKGKRMSTNPLNEDLKLKTKQGNLMKRGMRAMHNWKMRWMVLKGAKLCYYESKEAFEASTAAKGEMEFTPLCTVIDTGNYPRMYSFKIDFADKPTLWMVAANGKERDEWIQAFQVIARLVALCDSVHEQFSPFYPLLCALCFCYRHCHVSPHSRSSSNSCEIPSTARPI
jgi:hypothetical protein